MEKAKPSTALGPEMVAVIGFEENGSSAQIRHTQATRDQAQLSR